MSVLADHIAALIVHRATMESTGNWGTFQADIAEDLVSRYSLDVPIQLIEDACKRIRDFGGCTILPNPLAGDMYLINVQGAFRFFDPDNGPNAESSMEFDTHWQKMNAAYPAMRAYYHGREAWISRAVDALRKRDLFSDESNIESILDGIPASDRIVAIDHNSAELVDAVNALDKLEEAVRADNSEKIPIASEKRRFVEQLAAAKKLLKLETISTRALSALVLPVLTYLSLKFADEAIGTLASELLKLFASLFGISF